MEVIMAIAIMGMAMVIIGNMVFLGSRSAAKSKWNSEAQILCDTKMAEIASGVLPLQNNSGSSVPENPNWVYSVEVQSSNLEGLLSVTVTVQQSPSVTSFATPFSVTRLMPDPNFEPEVDIIQ